MNHSVDLEVSEARGAIFNSLNKVFVKCCKNNKKELTQQYKFKKYDFVKPDCIQ